MTSTGTVLNASSLAGWPLLDVETNDNLPLVTEILAERYIHQGCGLLRMRPLSSNGGAVVKTIQLPKVLLTPAKMNETTASINIDPKMQRRKARQASGPPLPSWYLVIRKAGRGKVMRQSPAPQPIGPHG